MLTRVRKWGHSQGRLLFAKSVLDAARIRVGDRVRVSVQEGRIIVEPASGRGRYELQALVSRMPEEYPVEEADWGPPAGKETW